MACRQHLRCYKPHRSCFETICATLDVDPAETVFVGDSPITDVDGSRHAGLAPIWINRRNLAWPAHLNPDDTVITSLVEILDVVGIARQPA